MTDTPSLLQRHKAIENIYPLTPMQEGLLFHTLAAPKDGLYTPQIVIDLEGPLHADLMQAAWRDAIARHGVLRSSFHWQERDQPFQVVRRTADLPWTTLDWSDTDAPGQKQRLGALLEGNRRHAFDLRHPPLVTLHWIDRGGGRFTLVLRYHHVILDGWSASRLVVETLRLYLRRTGAPQPPLPPPRPFADYVGWLMRQNREAARDFWKGYLSGGGGPTRLFPWAASPPTGGPSGFARLEWSSEPSLAPALLAFCQHAGLTLNTVLQGALGLLIARRTGEADVLFGTTTAGRPPTLPGAMEMIGLFINTLPVRVIVEQACRLTDWLSRLQARQAASVEHEHLALRDIQGGADPLFDCLLILENYPLALDRAHDQTIRITGLAFDERTHYPLTLFAAAVPEHLRISARFATGIVDPSGVAACLDELGGLLSRFTTGPDTQLGVLLDGVRLKQKAAFGSPKQLPVTEARRAQPATQTERMLAAAWSDVLKRPAPSPDDHFFALGGHSLLAARVIARVRREMAIDLPVRALFDRPVLAELAAYIDALRGTRGPGQGHIELEL